MDLDKCEPGWHKTLADRVHLTAAREWDYVEAAFLIWAHNPRTRIFRATGGGVYFELSPVAETLEQLRVFRPEAETKGFGIHAIAARAARGSYKPGEKWPGQIAAEYRAAAQAWLRHELCCAGAKPSLPRTASGRDADEYLGWWVQQRAAEHVADRKGKLASMRERQEHLALMIRFAGMIAAHVVHLAHDAKTIAEESELELPKVEWVLRCPTYYWSNEMRDLHIAEEKKLVGDLKALETMSGRDMLRAELFS